MNQVNAPWCDECWDRKHPDKPSPRTGDRFLERRVEACFLCWKLTCSGLYVPTAANAEGSHALLNLQRLRSVLHNSTELDRLMKVYDALLTARRSAPTRRMK